MQFLKAPGLVDVNGLGLLWVSEIETALIWALAISHGGWDEYLDTYCIREAAATGVALYVFVPSLVRGDVLGSHLQSLQ